ncbi:Retron-type reverse transcriptase [Bradyrhizobium sp. CCBAU 11430]|uniref:RNA-directed DNA polymerase n=1 Tax=unclassified Bradyrhizobium TaxID=2631580 RepID=UPI0023067A39|nr:MULTISPECIES: RNA-directed DNA polymerase [unclassified Bradyrhizobium]MDA9419306.1 Retron-type reverse transcriptase [Bradyrhizobium sp. CCBAU 25360]MDA9512212.1 Retron-type reverse transcriptase [Bradyrhizobium sp. CCBAU 11430]
MSLSRDSIKWAIANVTAHSDGDLFPRVTEIEAISDLADDFVNLIEGKPLTEFTPGAHRRFIVPKDEVSYRQATQLDPQDNIILSSVLHQYGEGIENRRGPPSKIFSYRFHPTEQHGLYDRHSSWNEFWNTAAERGLESGSILYCDISDFYNQIYHHTLENQLIASGFPNQVTKWIITLMESTTAGVSRGVPIGPHAAHLLAEASLIPVDNSMSSVGMNFIRYADDIIIFDDNLSDSKRSLGRLATILDKQQRLTLQKHKTRFFHSSDFSRYCAGMIEDRPINSEEAQILHIVRRYSGGDPYRTVSYDEIRPEDWTAFSEGMLKSVIEDYIATAETDFIRLRWFYRRLAQIGHPGAIRVSLDNIERLTPCFASICSYLASVQNISQNDWLGIGAKFIELLETESIAESEYFRLSILSLFSRNSSINHFSELAKRYAGSDPFAKREILLAAKTSNATDWLREFKEDFEGMDAWQKRAYLYCTQLFPADERKYFINRWTFSRPFDAIVAKWAKRGG